MLTLTVNVMCLILHSLTPINSVPQVDWDIRANRSAAEPVPDRSKFTRNKMNSIMPLETLNTPPIPRDCLQTIRECDTPGSICRLDLEIYKQFCGDWVDERSLVTCQVHFVEECRSALKTMNFGRPNLRHCTCDGYGSRSIEDLSKCNLLRRNLNNHPCLHGSPIAYRETTKPQIQPVTELTVKHQSDTRHPADLKDRSNFREFTSHERSASHATNRTEPQVFNNLLQPNVHPKQKPIDLVQGVETVLVPDKNVTNHISHAVHVATLGHMTVIPSCLSLLEKCTQNLNCAKSLNRFRALCTARSCDRFREQCESAYKDFVKFETQKNCTCQNENEELRKRRCADYETKILQNQCIVETSKMNTTNVPNESEIRENQRSSDTGRNPSRQWQAGSVNHKFDLSASKMLSATSLERQAWNSRNCFDVYTICVGDPSCLRHYLRLVGLCERSTKRDTCRLSCNEALKSFYSQPHTLSYQALSCSCPPDDYDCEIQQEILRPSCNADSLGSGNVCSQLWISCQSAEVCRVRLSRVLSICPQPDSECGSNFDDCVAAYLEFWTTVANFDCVCIENEMFTQGHSSSLAYVDCETFRSFLALPPCVTSVATATREELSTGKFSQTCFVTQRLGLPFNMMIRLYSEPVVDQSRGLSRCSTLCNCVSGCQHQFCTSKQHKMSVNPPISFSQPQTNMNRTTETDGTQLAGYSSCQYMPLIDPGCICEHVGEVWCDVEKRTNKKHIFEHQLIVTYDKSELSTILHLLKENVINQEFHYFATVLEFGHTLTRLTQNFTRSRECSLNLVAHRELKEGDLTPDLIRINFDSQKLDKTTNYAQLIFVISSVNEYTSTEHKNPCVPPFRILGLMINRRFPHVRHHPVLSVLKRAVLSNKPFVRHSLQPESESNKTTQLGSKTSLINNQPITWRQPRTSQSKIADTLSSIQQWNGTNHLCSSIRDGLIGLLICLLFCSFGLSEMRMRS